MTQHKQENTQTQVLSLTFRKLGGKREREREGEFELDSRAESAVEIVTCESQPTTLVVPLPTKTQQEDGTSSRRHILAKVST